MYLLLLDIPFYNHYSILGYKVSKCTIIESRKSLKNRDEVEIFNFRDSVLALTNRRYIPQRFSHNRLYEKKMASK
jgi:hypothetical protein